MTSPVRWHGTTAHRGVSFVALTVYLSVGRRRGNDSSDSTTLLIQTWHLRAVFALWTTTVFAAAPSGQLALMIIIQIIYSHLNKVIRWYLGALFTGWAGCYIVFFGDTETDYIHKVTHERQWSTQRGLCETVFVPVRRKCSFTAETSTWTHLVPCMCLPHWTFPHFYQLEFKYSTENTRCFKGAKYI